MELYFIRHAQSTNNALAHHRERVCDPPLTELGLRQAKVVAQHLTNGQTPEAAKSSSVEATRSNHRRGYSITRLYCSPMMRALQTAQPIGQALGIAPEIWVNIHEQGGIFLDHGEAGGIIGYSGKTRSEILSEFPNFQLPDDVTEGGWWNNGYEEWPACHGRAIKVARQLREWGHNDERIALVSHGGFIDALLKALCNQLPSHHLCYHHYNTAITRLDFDQDNRLHLRYLNRVDHLPSELIS
jgi:broad specificity phosphatase PhoE